MSAIEGSLPSATDADFVTVLPPSQWDRLESLLSRLSERLNPILVKEARQALRSKQFATTFFLMLAAGWGWSIIGLANIGPAVYYSAEGPTMFVGYYVILMFPLLIVAPYSAYHSLSSERQDRTYELVSITSLGAHQIVSGKLGSIMLQMMMYLSAIFPCLAFTYLLRGLDIFSILLVVVYTCCQSLGLAVLGLLLATLAPPRQRQIANAVIFAIVLFIGLYVNLAAIMGMVLVGGSNVDTADFWLTNLAMLTVFLNYFAIVFLTARSQLMTVCQNRSTDVRIALVVAQLSFLGWMIALHVTYGGDVMYGFVFFTTLFWYLSGVFLTSESGVLSPRVKRDLPQSTLGRIFLTLFAPGPGTGYLFIIANVLAASVLAILPYQTVAGMFGALSKPAGGGTFRASTRSDLLETCVIVACYLIIYLGVGKLIVKTIGYVVEIRPTMRVILHIGLVAAGSAIPWAIQMTDPALWKEGYSALQITNPVWTTVECCFRRVPYTGPLLLTVLPIVAALVFLLNLPSLVNELNQVRVAKPERMLEEDAELAIAAARVYNPWDRPASD